MLHIPHCTAYTDSSMHADRVALRTMKQFSNKSPCGHRSPASPRLGDWQWVFQAAVGFRQIIRTPHTDILYCIIGNQWNNCKTAFICLYLFGSHTLRSAIFLGRLSRKASPSLIHILTSFVRTMLTKRPCHGPWRGLGDSALKREIAWMEQERSI